MLVIGLTGGIGSGKSTAAQLFSQLGITVIDADLIAREVVAPSSKALAAIISRYGPEIVDDAGQLKRGQLRELIFNDSQARQWLENLIHPQVRARMQALVLEATSPYCILMIPLLLETSRNELIERILVVDVPEQVQISRTQTRDRVDVSQVKNIMRAQLSREQRLAQADDIISNEGDLQNLQQQVDRLHAQYLQLAAAKAGGI